MIEGKTILCKAYLPETFKNRLKCILLKLKVCRFLPPPSADTVVENRKPQARGKDPQSQMWTLRESFHKVPENWSSSLEATKWELVSWLCLSLMARGSPGTGKHLSLKPMRKPGLHLGLMSSTPESVLTCTQRDSGSGVSTRAFRTLKNTFPSLLTDHSSVKSVMVTNSRGRYEIYYAPGWILSFPKDTCCSFPWSLVC